MGTWNEQFNSMNYGWIHELRDSTGYAWKKPTHENPGLSQLSCCIYAAFSCPLITQLYHLKICITVYWLIFSCLRVSGSPVVEREGFIARILRFQWDSSSGKLHPPVGHYTPPLHQQTTLFGGSGLKWTQSRDSLCACPWDCTPRARLVDCGGEFSTNKLCCYRISDRTLL